MVTTTAVALAVALAAVVPQENSVTGRVVFNGIAPPAETIDMASEPHCRDAHGNAVTRQRVRVSAQNGLADVIVHVKAVRAATPAAPAAPVVLDQKGCMYVPSVLALRVGQPLVIQNSDPVLHNVHASPKKSAPFNLGQPMAGLKATRTFKAAELAVGVKCDIHEWMQASIGVFDDPFFAVTDADGRFSIDGLPRGDYEIEAWHPTLGLRTQRATVGTTVTITLGG
ncbi:MAG: carboxypeptidase regulatory-like domain-containing protein [Gemmatimonadota bacterium]